MSDFRQCEATTPIWRRKQIVRRSTIPTHAQICNGLLGWVSQTISYPGQTLTSYFHNTPASFGSFAPYQHFGDRVAAQKRAQARKNEQHRLIEVWLAIKNPWHTIDDEAANLVLKLVTHAKEKDIFDESTEARIHKEISETGIHWHAAGQNYNFLKWQYTMVPFVNELIKLGYDGLSYDNKVEGGISYVPFRADQIWWVDRDEAER